MAIADYFVSPGSGNDTTGDGSVGTPWATNQKALDTITQGTDGDLIHVQAGTADVLSAALVFTTYGTPSINQPVGFHGYTSTKGDGGIGEISGGGSVSIIDTNTLDAVSFYKMKIGNTGSAQIIDLDNGCSVIDCEIHTSSHVQSIDLDNDCVVIGCYIHSLTNSGARGINIINTATIIGNFIDHGNVDSNGAINAGSFANIIGNIVKCNHVSAQAILGGTGSKIINNSVYNEAAGTEDGIAIDVSGNSGVVIMNNAIEGWSGVGGSAISSLDVAATAMSLVANNLFFNNTSETTYSNDLPLIDVGGISASSSPFTDPSNNDFTMSTEGKAKGFISTMGDGTTTNFMDLGAAQREEPAGGGVAQALAY